MFYSFTSIEVTNRTDVHVRDLASIGCEVVHIEL